LNSISEDDFRGLPEAPLAKFLALEAIAREKLLKTFSEHDDDMLISIAKQSYMSTVSVAARSLKIDALIGIESRSSSLGAGFDSFFKKVVETTIELRLTASEYLNLYSVKISKPTLGKIKEQIGLIRNSIPDLDIDEKRKDRLRTLLGYLDAELERPRSSLSRLMAILGLIGSITALGVGTLADIPSAIGTITTLIGQQKDEEPKRLEDMRDEIKLLPPPLEGGKE
jgi:hypothetical protein